MTHDLMSCLDWAFLNPLLKRSAVSTIWGPQCPPRREKGNPMAEPEDLSLPSCPQQWGLGELISFPSASVSPHVNSPRFQPQMYYHECKSPEQAGQQVTKI